MKVFKGNVSLNEHPVMPLNNNVSELTVRCSDVINALNLRVTPQQFEVTTQSLKERVGISLKRNKFYKQIVTTLLMELRQGTPITKLLDSLLEKQPSLNSTMKSSKNTNEIAFNVSFDSQGRISKRVLLLLLDADSQNSHISGFTFGNVDLFLVPEQLLGFNVENFEFSFGQNCQIETIPNGLFVRIARFLDHGQRMNLAELKKYGVEISHNSNAAIAEDAYQQYFNDVSFYAEHAPNGSVMYKTTNDVFNVVHQTKYKREISESGFLKISRAGCMGNLVYTTELVGEEGNLLGGHAIGLHEREYAENAINKDHFIFMTVEQTSNKLTNWIDKLGRGGLFLDARKVTLSTNVNVKYREIDRAVSHKSLAHYRRIAPLLVISDLYRTSLKYLETNQSTIQTFNLVKQALRDISEGKDSICNGIFFEILKDFILLFQDDPQSQEFLKLDSFNMDNQYKIFFRLDPNLKKDWDTGRFPVAFEAVLDEFTKRGLIKSKKDQLQFMRFFLDRLAYYINVGCLEGRVSRNAAEVKSFNELAKLLPNLAGIIYNSELKKKFKASPFFEHYECNLRNLYNHSYDDRGIDITVKCGISRTEEIGIRENASVKFFDFDVFQNEHGNYGIDISPNLLPLRICGVSEKNGFTKRTLNPLSNLNG